MDVAGGAVQGVVWMLPVGGIGGGVAHPICNHSSSCPLAEAQGLLPPDTLGEFGAERKCDEG